MKVEPVETATIPLPAQVAAARVRREAGVGSERGGARIALARTADDRTPSPQAALPGPVRPAWVPDFIEQWPMQKIAIDMVDFAEELHRCLAVASGSHTHVARSLCLTLIQLDASLTKLLARSGIERDDPTGSAFDPHSHQEVVQQPLSGNGPGTVVRALSSSWTLNGQLLRPAMVVVSTARPDKRPAVTMTVVSPSHATADPGR